MPEGELTAEAIAERIQHLNLATDRQVQEVWSELGTREVTPVQFQQLALRRELLTNFQLERLMRGERNGYFYGDYKVLYLIGGGSFARVYRAAHKDTGKVVAVKVLRKRYCDDKTQTDHFSREGQMGMRLRHENIVPIYEVVSKGREHFFVMEFVEGRNLREFLKVRKQLDPLEATKLTADMCAGLKFATERGCSHRDLKLTNVIVSSRGVAKLLDFGLGNEEDESEDDEGAPTQRTIEYAGLERATGVRNGDARSDIFFLGCIFYHLLLGDAPMPEKADRIQKLSKQRFLDIVPIHKRLPELPSMVSHIVNKSMDLDVDRRYQTPAQMLVDLNIAVERLKRGEADVTEADDQALAAERAKQAALLIPDHERRAVMVVESNAKLQDAFRDQLKKLGYRVLVTSDPERALQRFQDGAKAADALLFSACALGDSALEAFNRFGDEEATRDIPAMLLVDDRHKHLAEQAKLADHRLLMAVPVKNREFRRMIRALAPPPIPMPDEDDDS